MLLHHGSKYNHVELMPGYKRTGEKINWDETESNDYLYATTSADDATGMALASTVEQSFQLDRFQHHDDKITITVSSEGELPTLEELLKLQVYVYTIKFDPKDGWEKVKNQHNNMDGEYRTKKNIKSNIESTKVVKMANWLKNKKVTIIRSKKPQWLNWSKGKA